MELEREQHGIVTVLSLRGAIDIEATKVLLPEVMRCKSAGLFQIVLEMRDVPAIDSVGLETIQSLAADLGRRGGDLRLAAVNEICRDILTATRVESLVQVFSDLENAVRSYT